MKKAVYIIIVLIFIFVLTQCDKPEEQDKPSSILGVESQNKSLGLGGSQQRNGSYGQGIKGDAAKKEFIPKDCAKEENKDNCYWSNAIGASDSSYCDKIEKGNVFINKDSCYYSVASKTKDEALCDKIGNKENRENCHNSFNQPLNPFQPAQPAEKKQYPLDCAKEDNKDSCYWNNALATLDSSYCGNIEMDSVFISKDTCYSTIAFRKKDKSLCAKIENKDKRDSCDNNVQ